MNVSANGAVVAARDVTRRYGEGDTAVDALRGVTVDIAPAKATAVMGPSGSGKSTLMHILAGLDKPSSGSVGIAGTEITTLGDNDLTKLRREHIGFVFQFFNLLPMLEREGEHPPAAHHRRREARRGVARAARRGRGPHGQALAPSVGALRRSAAARRDRAGADLEADRALRRRADRQPRLDDEPRDPRAAASLGRRVRPDDRDGDARCACRRGRTSRAVPGRRLDRARDGRVRPADDPRRDGRARTRRAASPSRRAGRRRSPYKG